MVTVLAVVVVVIAGVTGYSLLSGDEVYANHTQPVDMERQFSFEQLPEQKTIIKHASGLQYAGTESGLFVSEDGGKFWKRSYPFPLPVTMITTFDNENLYAFVVGKGLFSIRGDETEWSLINNQMGTQFLVSLSSEEGEINRLVARNQYGKQIISDDGGESWVRADGFPKVKTMVERRGEKLFNEKCQSCHGIAGIGETYTIEALTNRDYLMAPPLDESAHAWHHTDEALMKTILEGSSRQSRMPAWGDLGVTKADASHLVAYIKSLWGERIRDCQGPRHMQCM